MSGEPPARTPATGFARLGLFALYGLLCVAEWLSYKARTWIGERLYPDKDKGPR